MQFAADFKLSYGTIPILRQQKNWMGGFGKWPFLPMSSTVFIIHTDIVGGLVGWSEKSLEMC